MQVDDLDIGTPDMVQVLEWLDLGHNGGLVLVGFVVNCLSGWIGFPAYVHPRLLVNPLVLACMFPRYGLKTDMVCSIPCDNSVGKPSNVW